MLTNENLESQKKHLGGVQRIYKIGKYKLSLVNAPVLHSYPFAWEAAIIKDGNLDYSTPLTSDVEVFETETEANEFIQKAFKILSQGE